MAKSKRQESQNSPHDFSQSAPKVLVYDAIAALNRDFEQVLCDLGRLEALGLFRRRWQRKFVRTWRATLEETRAWVSFEAVEILHQREEREWTRFGRIRQRAEQLSESAVPVPTKTRDPKLPRRVTRFDQSCATLPRRHVHSHLAKYSRSL